ncbi:MAG TPA: outer membrane beta-barrel protein [Terriglobales bacterium]|nr:outer membrane beta-barrel protein [Terriglobales bacterium]
MRRALAIWLVVVACSFAVAAQEYPKDKVFGGFQYTSFDAFNIQHVNLLGWNAQFTHYLNKPFGITGEVTGSYGSPTVGGIGVSLPTYTFMFGPTMRAPLEKSTPFVHALFGAAHMSNTKGIYSSTGFALALGGGWDVKIGRNIDWRVVQVDYLATRLQDPTGTGTPQQENFRFATGIVYKF